MKSPAAMHKVLLDFNDASDISAWQVVNDDVMGGTSTSCFEQTQGMAVFRGEVSLENNGGFASVRSSPMRVDLAGYGFFVIKSRGDGHRYKFTMRTATGMNAPIYQSPFETKSGIWDEVQLACKNFVPTFRGRVLVDAPALNPAQVVSVGFLIADKQAGPFRLEIAWIRVSHCES
jgi:monofunctional biosynthetic peptidoglycan transglycosylase